MPLQVIDIPKTGSIVKVKHLTILKNKLKHILKAPGNPYIIATGGTEVQIGNWHYHIFNSTDTFEVITLSNNPTYNQLKVLRVAGGGSGGGFLGGGGGGGGVLEDLSETLSSTGSLPVVIGAGAAANISAVVSGSDSSFNGVSVTGGGGGASRNGNVLNPAFNAKIGGSGGGGAGPQNLGAAGTAGQGFAGGNSTSNLQAGGGGGASTVGTIGDATVNGNGGAGYLSQITKAYYGGGGGGGGFGTAVTSGLGGIGGGGKGGDSTVGVNGFAGTVNTGGGGGGSKDNGTIGGNGGSGIVIIGYFFPSETGWDSHTDTVANYMTSLGSAPSEARYEKMNTLIKNLKGEGFFGNYNIWTNILDCLQLFYGETSTQILVDWKMKDGAGVYDAILINSPVFVANSHVLINGTGSRSINNVFKPSNGTNFTLNSNFFGFLSKSSMTSGEYVLGTNTLSNPYTYIRVGSTAMDEANSSSTYPTTVPGVAAGYYLNNRISNTQFKITKDLTSVTLSSNSTSLNTNSFRMAVGSTAQMQAFIAGGNITGHELQLENSITAYIS